MFQSTTTITIVVCTTNLNEILNEFPGGTLCQTNRKWFWNALSTFCTSKGKTDWAIHYAMEEGKVIM